MEIPRIFAQANLGSAEAPKIKDSGIFSALADATSDLTKILADQREAQEKMEASELAAKYDAGMDLLKEQVKTQAMSNDPGDFAKRTQLYTDGEAELRARLKDSSRTAGGGRLLDHKMNLMSPKKKIEFTIESHKDLNSYNKGLLDASEDRLSSAYIATDDPVEQDKSKTEYAQFLAGMTKGAFPALNVEEAEKKFQAFEEKIMDKLAGKMNGESPSGFLAALDNPTGPFAKMTADKKLKWADEARKAGEHRDRKSDAIVKAVKNAALRTWEADANQQLLTRPEREEEVKVALAGMHPHITAAEARRLLEVNNNPPSSEGDVAVNTTMTTYYLSHRDKRSIGLAQAELRELRKTLKGPESKTFRQAANELQSDSTGLDNREAGRTNFAVAGADAYWQEKVPKYSESLVTLNEGKEKNRYNAAQGMYEGLIREGRSKEQALSAVRIAYPDLPQAVTDKPNAGKPTGGNSIQDRSRRR